MKISGRSYLVVGSIVSLLFFARISGGEESPPSYSLRSEPITISLREVPEIFDLTDDGRPRVYVKNDYEAMTIQGDAVVIDHATGLMWQQAGSSSEMPYTQIHAYLTHLNRTHFAGFHDWRLPTMQELLSLVEEDAQSSGVFIEPIFDTTQAWCWSSDRSSDTILDETNLSDSAFGVNFGIGGAGWGSDDNYIRCVRSGK